MWYNKCLRLEHQLILQQSMLRGGKYEEEASIHELGGGERERALIERVCVCVCVCVCARARAY